MSSQSATLALPGRRPGELFGHPTCLFTLFFTEFWERFSFYGMKALLILYLVNYLFWRQADASHVFAWYAGLVYATPILGGIVADRWLGARWSVVVGGVIIAIGHFLLAFEPMPFFYSGLGCLIIGTGFLKPNISTQVGALYRSNDGRRDSAFTIFYMGINLGAFFGPLVCGWLRINKGYHYGFAAAGVGMVVGLILYIIGMKRVVARERLIATEEAQEVRATPASPDAAAAAVSPADPGPTGRTPAKHVYRDRCIVLVVICVFAILFWVGFEQAANVMNLWADQHTNMHIFRAAAPPAAVNLPETPGAVAADARGGIGDWRISAEMTQSINPFFIVTLAVVFAWLWQYLERRKRQPSTPLKMAFGVFFLSLAYGIMLLAAQAESRPTAAPLSQVPAGVNLHEYGATRLSWADGTLQMRGVLTDNDWMRALAASSSPEYQQAVTALQQAAAERHEEVRRAKSAGRLARDATWEVQVRVPPEVGELVPVADWPLEGEQPKVRWLPEERTLCASGTLSDRDRAQVLAAGADPEFRAALTSIYVESSVLKVSIVWLLAFYLVITIGELCLSPVGLSLVTKAAPPRYVGLFMGLWFFTTGFIANFAAHTIGGYWGTMTPGDYFMIFGVIGVVATVIMLLLLRVLRPMLHGIH